MTKAPRRTKGPTYPLDVPATLSKSDQAVVGDPLAARYVEALQPGAVLGYCVDRGLGDGVTQNGVCCRHGERDVERIEVAVVRDEGDEPGICQVTAAGEGQALNPCAFGQRHDAAVVDVLSQGSQV